MADYCPRGHLEGTTSAQKDRGLLRLNGVSVQCSADVPSEVAARLLTPRCGSLPVSKLSWLTRPSA